MILKQLESKKAKRILALVLAGVVLLSSVAGCFMLLRQPAGVVEDTTPAGLAQAPEATGGNGTRKEPQAVISNSVTMFQEDKAAAINAAIQTCKGSSLGMHMTVKSGTPLDSLGMGDIFFLDGSAATPLGEPYFGKVSSIKTQNGTTFLTVEPPMVDEVFDVLTFSTENMMDGAQATIETLEGVQVTQGGTLISGTPAATPPAATPTASPSATSLASPLANAKPVTLNQTVTKDEMVDFSTVEQGKGNTWSFDPKERLEIKVEVDLMEAYNKLAGKEEKKPTTNQTGSPADAVTVTAKGKVYHKADCFHIAKSKNKKTITLQEAVNAHMSACKNCLPPVLKDFSAEASLKLTGAVGVENLLCDIYYDWDILNGNGMQDLWANLSGTAFAEVGLTGSAELKLGGQDTELNLLFDKVKLQGLKEKLIPLGFISMTQSMAVVLTGGSRDVVRNTVQVMPVSILLMLYVDIQGNITFSMGASAKVSKDFTYDHHLVENGKVNLLGDLTTSEPTVDWSFELGVKGDADAHVGLSALVYVFNLNVLDVGLAKVGVGGEGKLSVEISNKTVSGAEPWFEASYYLEGYLKFVDIHLLLRCQAKLLGDVLSGSAEIGMDWLLLKVPLFSLGEKLSTRFSSTEMKNTHVTANDKDAVYYKDENGHLIMARDGFRTTLYDEEFFIICGIDQSYLYILKNTGGDAFSMYRVAKENQTAKEVLNNVSSVVFKDDEHFYYVDGFDNTVIRKFNRETFETTTFADLDYKVEAVNEQAGGLYVVTSEEDLLSWFLGPTNHYYLLNRQTGKVVTDYGQNPEVKDYYLRDCGSFIEAARIIAGGTLRQSATEVYWMTSDRSQHVLTEQTSGWHAQPDVGIFTTLYNDGEGDPYKIVLYREKDGTRVDVTTVQSNQAFFTLAHGVNGDWYFFDQTQTDMILYAMNEDFSNKRVLKTFPLEEVNFSLTECGTAMTDDCLYFYAIENEQTCTVIKRYSLY